MAERISLGRFTNKNLFPIEKVAKTAAAATLLLSTAGCELSSDAQCIIIPALIYGGALGLIWIWHLIDWRGGGGGGGHSGDPPLGGGY